MLVLLFVFFLQVCSGVNVPDFGYSKGDSCIFVKVNGIL